MIGSILAVTFDDHVQDGNEPIRFQVFGRCVRADRWKIVVDSWAYEGDDAPDEPDGNVCRFSIVRSAVRQLDVLKKCN